MNKTKLLPLFVLPFLVLTSGCETLADGTVTLEPDSPVIDRADFPSFGCVAVDENGRVYPFGYPEEGESTGFENGEDNFKVELTRLAGEVHVGISWRIDASYPYYEDPFEFRYASLSPFSFDYTHSPDAWRIECDEEDSLPR